MYTLKNKLTILCILAVLSLQAQDNLSYGIKAGLGLSTLLGEKEMDSQGITLEEGGYLTGFHIGVVFNIDIIDDKFGVAPEILFTQRGGRYKYNGPGSLTVNAVSNGTPITFEGRMEDAFSMTNSYITIPVLLYYKPIKRVKLSLGLDAAFLVASTGSGESKFIYTNGAGVEEIAAFDLDYNYNRDKPGEAKSETLKEVIIGGVPVEYPESIGAYYYNDTDEGNYFKVFDLGLNADVSLFITEGISLGLRANYGLLDISNNKLDVSKQNPTISRADADRNLSFMVSLGFNF